MGKPNTIKASLTPDAVEKLKAGKEGEKYAELEARETEFQFDFGDDTEEAVAIFGDNVVRSYIVGHCSFTLQGIARSLMKAGKTDEEIQAHFYDPATEMNVYRPGEYTGRKSAVEKEHDRIEKMSPEAKEKEIDALRAMLEGLEGK